jgi:hypothetical protein
MRATEESTGEQWFLTPFSIQQYATGEHRASPLTEAGIIRNRASARRSVILTGEQIRTTMEIKIVRDAITKVELNEMAKQQFGDMVKAVVDVEQGIMAIGGELHSDEEAMLLDQGSLQKNLWGINLYPERPVPEWIEFDSLINVRPSGGNRSRYVESTEIRDTITTIVNRLVEG